MAGRPTKEPGEKMDVPLKIMLTPTQDELIRLAAKGAGADVSAWARAVLLREANEANEAPKRSRHFKALKVNHSGT